MANILLKTEALDDVTEWTQSDLITVTANTDAAPAFAGGSAGLADTLVDSDAANVGTLDGAFKTITSDTTDWLFSIHVKKDTSTTRFPELQADMQNGTRVQAFALLDTKNGLMADLFGGVSPFAAKGVVDVDASWWRFWGRIANNGTGNNAIRFRFSPAASSDFSVVSAATQGTCVAWGANLTNTSTIQTYEPDPFYSFSAASLSWSPVQYVVRGQRVRVVPSGMTPGDFPSQ